MTVTHTTERGTYGLVDCGEGFWAIELRLASGQYVGDVGRAESPMNEGGPWLAARTFFDMPNTPGILLYGDNKLDALVTFTQAYEEIATDESPDPRWATVG
jgi:hypothetical protein